MRGDPCGQQPSLLGNDNFTAAPSGMFRTKDGHINIAANQQEQWEHLADALGLPELKSDVRFAKRDVRKANRHALTPLLEAKLKAHDTAHWVCALNRLGIPAGAIPTLQEALASPQVAHRGSLQTVAAEGIGDITVFSTTAKFEATPGAVTAPPPRLGAHTPAVLAELGYSPEEVGSLRERGVV